MGIRLYQGLITTQKNLYIMTKINNRYSHENLAYDAEIFTLITT
jgi:hypothetical protein